MKDNKKMQNSQISNEAKEVTTSKEVTLSQEVKEVPAVKEVVNYDLLFAPSPSDTPNMQIYKKYVRNYRENKPEKFETKKAELAAKMHKFN